MSDPVYFSKVKLLDGSYAEVKDAVARAAIVGATRFIGVTTTSLLDGQTISQVTISGNTVDLVNGDLMLADSKEFIYASVDGKVHELGDMTGLGSLAYQNSASGSFTPSGSVSKPDVDVTLSTSTVAAFSSAGSVTAGTANVPTAVTLPTLSLNVLSGEILEFAWSAGSVTAGTANTPTAVTLPSASDVSVVTGVTAALHETPSFTGTQDTVTVT